MSYEPLIQPNQIGQGSPAYPGAVVPPPAAAGPPPTAAGPPPSGKRSTPYEGDEGRLEDIDLPAFPIADAPPPSQMPSHVHLSPQDQLQKAIEQTSPEEAIKAYDAFLQKKFFAKHGLGPTMVIDSFNPSIAYHVSVRSFTETRSHQHKHRPWSGTAVDGPQYGAPPGMWVMVPRAPTMFQPSSVIMKVPHTEEVRKCFKCRGRGELRCTSCRGWGTVDCFSCRNGWVTEYVTTSDGERKEERRRCFHCNGRGETRCTWCHGYGYKTCSTCDGLRSLVHWIDLHVDWKNEIAQKVHEEQAEGNKQLPEACIKSGSKVTLWQEDAYIIEERPDRMNPIVNPMANSCIAQMRQFTTNTTSRMLLAQRLMIEGIPVYEVLYKIGNKEYQFWLYGQHGATKVYAHNYPKNMLKVSCCWFFCVLLILLVILGIIVGVIAMWFPHVWNQLW